LFPESATYIFPELSVTSPDGLLKDNCLSSFGAISTKSRANVDEQKQMSTHKTNEIILDNLAVTFILSPLKTIRTKPAKRFLFTLKPIPPALFAFYRISSYVLALVKCINKLARSIFDCKKYKSIFFISFGIYNVNIF
jgi:hypothetical protein